MTKLNFFIFGGILLIIVGGALVAWRLGYFFEISKFFAAESVAPYEYDVNGDGANDTNLILKSCSSNSGATCLSVDSEIVGVKEINLGQGAPGCVSYTSVIRTIGNHIGTDVQEIGTSFCRGSIPIVAVIDIASDTVIGTAAPGGKTAYYADFAQGPANKKYPFLANGYGDTGEWGYACIYRPTLASSSECGQGFVRVNTLPIGTSTIFRAVSGFLQDLDGDGWEDINLPYEYYMVTVSPNTLQQINQLYYDVAISTEPNSPQGFHSGRPYGIHRAVTSSSGVLRDVMVGGVPVGSFSDANCNVSRFVGVLESLPGNPSSRVLKWARYLGFASTNFSVWDDPSLASNPPVSRPADITNGCIHIFSDARAIVRYEEAIIFNYFIQSAPIDKCVYQQYQLYIPPAWTQEKSTSWYTCFAKNLKSRGSWAMQALRESDGAGLTGGTGNYIWGMSRSVMPGDVVAYVVEILPPSVAFDLSDQPIPRLEVRILNNEGAWQGVGQFPVAGRPKMSVRYPGGAYGVGSYTTYTDLTLRDIDSDGLSEIQLNDGQWVGYSNTTHTFAVKTVMATPTPTVTVTATVAPSSSTKPGDLDSDGDVDIFDYNKLIGDFGKSGAGLTPDIDKDGDVDIFDYNQLIGNFGR